MEDLKLTISVSRWNESLDPEAIAEAIEDEIDQALRRINATYGINAQRTTDS